MNVSKFFYMSGIEKVAATRIYKRYGIKRNELDILVSLSAYLMLKDKKIVGRDIFCDWIGVNYRMEKKVYWYLKGLHEKGCLHRLAYRRPDGNCLAISLYGEHILTAFEIELKEIQSKEKVKNANFKNLQLDLSALPKGYTLMQAGRDS